MQSMLLNVLPPEILVLCFSFACTDDGTTGRSLALVCHYTRNLSDNVRFQSVAVLGMRQILLLTAVLADRASRGSRDTVRSLFISAFDRAGILPWSKYFSGRTRRHDGYRGIHHINFSIATIERDRATAAVSQLVRLVADEVHRLAVLGVELKITLIGRTFPHLTDLQTTSLQPPFVTTSSNAMHPRLPSLRCIQVRNQQGGVDALLLALSCNAPYDSITHLHVSDLRENLVPYLRIQLNIPATSPSRRHPSSEEETLALVRAATFTKLQHISVQLSEYIETDFKQALLELLDDCWLARSVPGASCGLLELLPAQHASPRELMEEWMDAGI